MTTTLGELSLEMEMCDFWEPEDTEITSLSARGGALLWLTGWPWVTFEFELCWDLDGIVVPLCVLGCRGWEEDGPDWEDEGVGPFPRREKKFVSFWSGLTTFLNLLIVAQR
jgi:hypothetical protein